MTLQPPITDAFLFWILLEFSKLVLAVLQFIVPLRQEPPIFDPSSSISQVPSAQSTNPSIWSPKIDLSFATPISNCHSSTSLSPTYASQLQPLLRTASSAKQRCSWTTQQACFAARCLDSSHPPSSAATALFWCRGRRLGPCTCW
mgnify:CR=1 FL=1